MARYKFRKRSRPKPVFHEIQESTQENARLLTPQRFSRSENEEYENTENTRDTSGGSDPPLRRHSPETVLFESQPDLLCRERLSPEIVPRDPKTVPQLIEIRENEDAEVEGEMLEGSDSMLFKLRPMDLFHRVKLNPDIFELSRAKSDVAEKDDAKSKGEITERKIKRSHLSSLDERNAVSDPRDRYRNGESTGDLLFPENYSDRQTTSHFIIGDSIDVIDCRSPSLSSLNELYSDATRNGLSSICTHHRDTSTNLFLSTSMYELSSPRASVSRSTTLRPNLKSRPRDDARTVADQASPRFANCYKKREKQFPPEEKWRQRLDDDQLPSRIWEPTVSYESHKYKSEFAHTRSTMYHPYKFHGSPICFTDGYREGDDSNRRKRTKPHDNGSLNGAIEKIGEHLAANWLEFRKTFTCLWQMKDGKTPRSECSKYDDTSSRYGRFPCDEFRYTPMSASSSCAFSPRNCENPTTIDCHATEFLLAKEKQSKRRHDGSPLRAEKIKSRTQEESTAARIESSLSVKRCKMILKLERKDEEMEEKRRRDAAICEKITEPHLPEEKSEQRCASISPSILLSCDKTNWESCSSLKMTSSFVDLPVQFGCEDCSKHLQKVKYQHTEHHIQSTTTLQDSQEYLPRRKNILSIVIAKVIACCIWLIKKLLYLLNSGYKKLRQIIDRVIPCLSESISKTQNSRTREYNRLIDTLRSENEKMLRALSEKVTRLSTDFVQIQTNSEATISVLASEVNGVHEISKKINENNILLTQELKKLYDKLEKIQLKSRSISSVSSCPAAPAISSAAPPSPLLPLLVPPSQSPQLPPPPPPPPLPPPPPSSLPPPPSSLPPPPPPPLPPAASPSLSTLLCPPKTCTSENTNVTSPLVPPTTLQLPMSSILPTTPNSSKSNRKIVTPMTQYSTPLLNRPSITVEDLLKVTLKKAPQNKENRRNTVPGPKGPVVSLDLLRNVKLKSARRRTNDPTGRSPRSGRIVKSRTGPSLNLSPIATRSEGNLDRILRQVNLNKRAPRRLLSSSSNFHDQDFAKDEAQC